MGTDKESHDIMLHYGYAILVYPDRSMGMVFRYISGVHRYGLTSWVGCAAAAFRLHVSIRR